MTIDNVLDLLQLITMCYIALRLGILSATYKEKTVRKKGREDYYNMFD